MVKKETVYIAHVPSGSLSLPFLLPNGETIFHLRCDFGKQIADESELLLSCDLPAVPIFLP